jgi:hypothetical protein
LGVPAVSVMTTRFVSAADLMRRVLGMPGHDFAVIEHPISSASDDDLRQLAKLAIAQVSRFLLPPPR